MKWNLLAVFAFALSSCGSPVASLSPNDFSSIIRSAGKTIEMTISKEMNGWKIFDSSGALIPHSPGTTISLGDGDVMRFVADRHEFRIQAVIDSDQTGIELTEIFDNSSKMSSLAQGFTFIEATP